MVSRFLLRHLLRLWLLPHFLGLLATPALASPAYRPEALVAIEREVVEDTLRGRRPVVVFDLDDTLINTRERTARILRDFASSTETRTRYPWEAARLLSLEPSDIHYQLADTLHGAGIFDESFIAQAAAYWPDRFFSDAYCAQDRPNPGAAAYVARLYEDGATIVYLTGRDRPRMGRGTSANLERLGFPAALERTFLIMKPSAQGDDLEFKISQFPAVAALGHVVAAFENEPANINALARGFPDSIMVFLDTIHSPKPDVPDARVFWVRDFNLGDSGPDNGPY